MDFQVPGFEESNVVSHTLAFGHGLVVGDVIVGQVEAHFLDFDPLTRRVKPWFGNGNIIPILSMMPIMMAAVMIYVGILDKFEHVWTRTILPLTEFLECHYAHADNQNDYQKATADGSPWRLGFLFRWSDWKRVDKLGLFTPKENEASGIRTTRADQSVNLLSGRKVVVENRRDIIVIFGHFSRSCGRPRQPLGQYYTIWGPFIDWT